ncbi:hypothetical protein [Bacillus solitudinis]|uniref:hypothetical protein n=1 Tax=Bacillus solitudinis TaxID=2014074 RepID=UPI000C239A67|nr:hypothetical protein [Bacillus solitudinis]
MENHEKQLIELVVGKVLDKHDVKPSKHLSKVEKAKIKDVVGNIQTEVERFLENQQKIISEKDFPKEKDKTVASPQKQISNESSSSRPTSPRSRKTFSDKNDISGVKTFVNRRK